MPLTISFFSPILFSVLPAIGASGIPVPITSVTNHPSTKNPFTFPLGRATAIVPCVFEKEPLPIDDPLLELDNVILLPHIGSATRETREKMSMIAVQNLINVFNGMAPLHEI